jgi:uncharacterized protein YxjI
MCGWENLADKGNLMRAEIPGSEGTSPTTKQRKKWVEISLSYHLRILQQTYLYLVRVTSSLVAT